MKKTEEMITSTWIEKDNSPVISVIAICYNHEKYIREALDSILAQETNFPFQVVIHDDASTDKSAAIIQEYAREYPHIIVPVIESENKYSKNPISIFDTIKPYLIGKYLAYIECDDYWTNPSKLQEQVDFLDGNPDYLCVAHNCTVVDQYGKPTGEKYPECKDTEYTPHHFFRGLLAGQSSTLVLRNMFTHDLAFLSLIQTIPAGPLDLAVNITLAINGRVCCLQKSMSAYRHITDGGSSYSANYRFDLKREFQYYSSFVQCLISAGKFEEAIDMEQWLSDILIDYEKQGFASENEVAPFLVRCQSFISSLKGHLQNNTFTDKESARMLDSHMDSDDTFEKMVVYVQESKDTCYSEEKSICSLVPIQDNHCKTFTLSQFSDIQSLRIDPMDCPCFLRQITASVMKTDGTIVPVSIKNSNGSVCLDGLVFNSNDPWIEFEIPNDRYESVTFSGILASYNTPEISFLYSVSKDYNSLFFEHADLKSKTLALQKELDNVRAETANQKSDILALQKELDNVRAETANQKSDILALQEKVESLSAEKERLAAELTRVQYAYDVISNSGFWRITKPARQFLDFIKEGYRLSKKTIYIFKNQGLKGVLNQYRLRRIRLRAQDSSTQNTLSNSSCIINSFIDNATNLSEPEIPTEWLQLQKNHPLISIIIAAKSLMERSEYLSKALDSLCDQLYDKLEVIIVADEADYPFAKAISENYLERLELTVLCINKTSNDKRDYWHEGICSAKGELIAFLEQEDTLTSNCLAYVIEAYNESIARKWEYFLIPDASFSEEGDMLSIDQKKGAGFSVGSTEALLHFGVFQRNKYLCDFNQFESWLLSLKPDQFYIAPWVGCYRTASIDVWKKDVNVRCIAFYLPQFHSIPENDEWWGKGFTEWVNVKKAKPLYQGHHQPRIPGELGYYTLDGEEGSETQKKQIALAKEYGIGGFCYYCYWFDGKRLLEMPLDRHLNDKTMDFPFCICWANENWTRQWDGQKNSILMSQNYKDGWAKQFILDMMPYLKDERYIRINGAPYILIYNLQDIPNPFESINTWRKIAEENGIEKLHISCVRRTPDARELTLSGYALDSLTDFPPHLLGMIGVDHDEEKKYGLGHGQLKDYRKACKYHIDMPKQNYTYFRTVMLEWDNTPRRGKNAYVFENFSYDDYKKWLYSAKQYAIRQNRSGENLVFINAWNEWAEGTYLEPSEPAGRLALESTKDVLDRR